MAKIRQRTMSATALVLPSVRSITTSATYSPEDVDSSDGEGAMMEPSRAANAARGLRMFAARLGSRLAERGFIASGRVFRRIDADGSGIVVDLQRTEILEDEPPSYYVNVGLLYGPHTSWRRSMLVGPSWPMASAGIETIRVGPDGRWNGLYRFAAESKAEADALADELVLAALDGLFATYDGYLSDPWTMVTAMLRGRAKPLCGGRLRPG